MVLHVTSREEFSRPPRAMSSETATGVATTFEEFQQHFDAYPRSSDQGRLSSVFVQFFFLFYPLSTLILSAVRFVILTVFWTNFLGVSNLESSPDFLVYA